MADDPYAGKRPYTPGLREVLKLANAEVGRLGHDYIGPEHYLLAIIRKREGLAAKVLMNLDVKLDQLKGDIEGRLELGAGPTVGLFAPNAEAKAVLESAGKIAYSLNHGWVGTEHLLIALAQEEGTLASKALLHFGVDAAKARAEVLDIIRGSKSGSVGAAAAATGAEPKAAFDKTPYTPGMREVLKLSKAEAGALGHDYIAPEHYLLAILRKGDGLAVETLVNLGVDLEELGLAIQRRIEPGGAPKAGLFSPNDAAKRVLGAAKEVAQGMRHGWVGTEHLLLALVEDEATLASKCLRGFGIEPAKARAEVVNVIEGANSGSATVHKHPIEVLAPNLSSSSPELVETLRRVDNPPTILPGGLIADEHYLLAILADESCAGAELLKRLGVDFALAKAEAHKALETTSRATAELRIELLDAESAAHFDRTMSEPLRVVWKRHEYIAQLRTGYAKDLNLRRRSQLLQEAAVIHHALRRELIGSDLLLLALMRDEKESVGAILGRLGATYQRVLLKVVEGEAK